MSNNSLDKNKQQESNTHSRYNQQKCYYSHLFTIVATPTILWRLLKNDLACTPAPAAAAPRLRRIRTAPAARALNIHIYIYIYMYTHCEHYEHYDVL